MMQISNVILSITVLGMCIATQLNQSPETNYHVVLLEANYSVDNTVIIDNTKEFIFTFPKSPSWNPYKIYAWSNSARKHSPLIVVVRQEKDVLSWKIPLQVSASTYPVYFKNTSRTLCHKDMEEISRRTKRPHFRGPLTTYDISQSIMVTLSTSSVLPIDANIKVEEVSDFFLHQNETYTLTVSPSQPKYYYYNFLIDGSETTTVIVDVTSDDLTCLIVSVQDSKCPVFDLNEDITYEGKYQTINIRGAITVTKEEFPEGFFVVFVVRGDNYDCSQENSIIPRFKKAKIRAANRTSTVAFQIRPSISKYEYTTAIVIVLLAISVFYVIFTIILCSLYKCSKFADVLDVSVVEVSVWKNDTDDVDAIIRKRELHLSDLARQGPEQLQKRSLNYLWHVTSIALFYSIPVVQLVYSYQKVTNLSGNEDICYYNFLCSHPMLEFNDFNHIFSNIGYVLLGILFLLITLHRHATFQQLPHCGIPKHCGLFYAMGVALIIEGILSACYHVCPNQSNFQFDTSFMYVITVLCMVEVYHNRHPDINATAYATFAVLGLAIFAVMVGILQGHMILWVVYVIFHIALCIFLSLKVYFLGYIIRGTLRTIDEWRTMQKVTDILIPIRKGRFLVLVIANICNYVMALMGFYCYLNNIDFATFVLGVLMGNCVLYIIIYIIMKISHGESICFQPALFGSLALVTWAASLYFFVNNTMLWTVTPAESRQRNSRCEFLNFYDYHDIWHLISAVALFFSFMLLLTIDDDLINTPHNFIQVF